MLDSNEKTNNIVTLLFPDGLSLHMFIYFYKILKVVIKQFLESLADSQFLHSFTFVNNKMISL